MTVRILVVDDHPVVRSGLRAVLSAEESLDVVAEAGSGEDALRVAGEHQPDVVLCDLRLGEGMDGIATTAKLRELPNPPAVLILTTYDRDAEILGSIEAGAAGYLLKDSAIETIVEAITKAAAGEVFLTPDVASRVVKGMSNPRPRLTHREVEVLRLLATGANNKEIAGELFVTEATVKSHLAHIFTKLDVDSRARAIRLAHDTGLI